MSLSLFVCGLRIWKTICTLALELHQLKFIYHVQCTLIVVVAVFFALSMFRHQIKRLTFHLDLDKGQKHVILNLN